jgi:hypothetical protein
MGTSASVLRIFSDGFMRQPRLNAIAQSDLRTGSDGDQTAQTGRAAAGHRPALMAGTDVRGATSSTGLGAGTGLRLRRGFAMPLTSTASGGIATPALVPKLSVDKREAPHAEGALRAAAAGGQPGAGPGGWSVYGRAEARPGRSYSLPGRAKRDVPSILFLSDCLACGNGADSGLAVPGFMPP